jgi:hypothetical protein
MTMGNTPAPNLDAWRRIDGSPGGNALGLPALGAGVPTVIIDVQGGLPAAEAK